MDRVNQLGYIDSEQLQDVVQAWANDKTKSITNLAGKTFSLQDLAELSKMNQKLNGNSSDLAKESFATLEKSKAGQQILVTLDNPLLAELRFDQQELAAGKWYLIFDGQPMIVPPRVASDPSAKLSGPEVAIRRPLDYAAPRGVDA